MTVRGVVAAGAIAASVLAANTRVDAAQAQSQRGAQAPAAAPAAQDARVLVTVMDPSGLVIQDATVTLVGLEDATKNAAPRPQKTTDKGSVIFDKVLPGRYTVQGEFPGFEVGSLKDIRVRSGDNKHIVILPLKGLTDSVTVSRDRQEAAADRVPLFGTALTREQIELLSEDPTEMRRQLMEMAGPDAVIKVDSFEGRDLPPKAQIKSVHITRDQFAAESHYAGGLFVEIVTQPGLGPLRGSTNFRFRDSSMDGWNPYVKDQKPASQNKNFGGYIGGSLVQNKASFSINFSGSNSYVQPNIVATLPDGTPYQDVVRFRSPSDSTYFNGYLDWAMTRDQTLRFSIGANRYNTLNQGVGQWDYPERAYDSRQSGYSFMLQEVGPLGRRFFMNTRFYGSLNKSQLRSKFEAPTIRVNEQFTSGGAQQAGGRRSVSYTIASDVDYVKGMNSWRAGISLDGYDYRSDESQNYLGTYTFATIDDFNAGKPRSYQRRIGDPLIDYFNMQAAFYLQDDIRIRKNLTITPGVRYEAQTHLDDYNNLMPRAGITWSPFKTGKTTLRASYGIFYDWISTGVYEQTLRVDGFRQQELNISDPSYPTPGQAGNIPATNRYLYSDNVVMPQTKRLSAGVNQQITRTISIGATYSDGRAAGRARGHNLNAPVNGVRPDPRFANVVEVVSDASAVNKSLSGNFSLSLAPPSPALQQARFNWRRTSFFGSFGINRSHNNTDGPFAVPVSNTIDTEWGPSGEDIHYRFNMSMNTNMLRNFNAGMNMNVGTAAPYTIRTGYDDNRDLVFNDRPVGVGRNTERGSGQFTINANFSYTFNIGSKKVNMPPGISISSVGGVMTVAQGNPSAASRYRISINANIFNITNHYNYVGYVGSMTSSYFRQPTNISGVRNVNLYVNFSF